MQPDQNTPQPPANYLDQIAPKPQKGSGILGNKPVFFGLIGIAILALILVVGLAINASANNIAPTERLAARLVSTKDTVDQSKDNIKSTQLRKINSDLGIYLTNTIRDITPILAQNNIKIDSLPKKATLAESNQRLLATLEDARLNVRFDRVYANEMSTQLEDTVILMRQIHKSTSSAKLKTFLANSIDTLSQTQQDFSNFNDTTS